MKFNTEIAMRVHTHGLQNTTTTFERKPRAHAS